MIEPLLLLPCDPSTREQSVALMRRALFGQAPGAPSKAAVQALGARLLAEPCLAPFQIWVVGSVLARPSRARDLDLLLTRRDGRPLSVDQVETALVHAQWLGISTLGTSVDTCFRASARDRHAGTLTPETPITTWKLENLPLTILMKLELVRFRRLGRFTVAYRRPAGDCNYYNKLPREASGGATRYLAPGVRLQDYLGA